MTKKSLVPMFGSFGATPSLKRFQSELGALFNELIEDIHNFGEASAFNELQIGSTFPKVNVFETEKGYTVKAAVAGFGKEDVNLELKNNFLVISADKKEEISEEDMDCLRREISSRSFRRVVRFPKKINSDTANASYNDGIISITIDKLVEDSDDGSTTINID